MPELRYQQIKSTAHIDAIVNYAETLLGIELKSVKKYRYSSLCPFHADTEDSLMVYVNKKDEVGFHCFGACKGDWDIYDVIMLRIASKLGGWVYYLGGLAEGQDAYDMLNPVVSAISGFSLKHRKTDV